MDIPVVYFDKTGAQNTDLTLQVARERCLTLGIKEVVVASTHGGTGFKTLKVFKGTNVQIIVVGISHSFHSEGWVMDNAIRHQLENQGAKVLISLHALGDDINAGFSGSEVFYPNQIVAETLRRFSQGMKVAVEITIMAAEAGLIGIDREVISIGGTHEGADTAIVVKPSYARHFLNFEIHEILTKPRCPEEG